MVKIENLPAKLRETGLFCCWRYEEGAGDKKPRKVPYNPRTGGRAQSNNPDTFAPLEVAAAASGPYDSLGVGVFNSLGAIDIDHCIEETGEISEVAVAIMSKMQAYTEYSPSGRGLRILFNASGFQYDKAKYYIKNDDLGLEVYIAGNTSRFVTLTGNALIPGLNLEERGEQLAAVLEQYMIRPAKPTLPAAPSGPVENVGPLDDMALIELAKRSKNGAEFTNLWAGDTSAYGGDDSRADMALCDMLAWWTNRDAERVDRLFRQSGLMREKWDRPTAGSTYGAITVQEAVDTCAGGYDPEEYRRQAAQEWEPPIPFGHIDTPGFPVDALPGPLADFVRCQVESTQTPEEMAGVLSLAVLATAFQRKYTVEITPDWREPLCLYTLAIAPPAERKSAIISALDRPIYEYEEMHRAFEATEIAQNQTERAMLEKSLQAAQTRATKGKKDFEAARMEAMDLSARLAEFKDKHPFRLLADDTTPEKLVDIMDTQDGCITVCSAEGGLFDALAGKRYDQCVNLDVYLKGHAGDPIKVDRIGRKSNYVPRPRLTLMLTVQPEVLRGLMSNSTMRGRGLCGRFLYAVCKSKVGHREIDPAAVPVTVREGYRQFMHRILGAPGSGVIHLGPEANRIRLDYTARIEHRLAEGEVWEFMRDWGGKLAGATLRIAALIHAAEAQGDPAELPIQAETMEAAIRIAEFLGPHAEAAYQLMGADEATADAKYLLRRIQDIGKLEIRKGELIQATRGKFRNTESMEPALNTLEDMNYIRRTARKGEGRGRPAEIIEVNPYTINTFNTQISN